MFSFMEVLSIISGNSLKSPGILHQCRSGNAGCRLHSCDCVCAFSPVIFVSLKAIDGIVLKVAVVQYQLIINSVLCC